MKKSTVIAYFGGTVETAAALKVSRPAVIQWPEDLPFSALGRIASLQPRAWKFLSKQGKEQPGARLPLNSHPICMEKETSS